jgi:organic hydroperoxide reductase OsmC/OhrA
MLWFLYLARERRLRVVSYADDAVGHLDGERITRVELRPRVEFEEDPGADVLAELHHGAHERCFLAASVNFPVEVMTA